MYIVVKNAFKRGFNKLTKNIEKSHLFFSKTYQQDFDHVEETW